MAYDLNRPAIVYQVQNLINGNTYIGITATSLKARAAGHWASRNKKTGFVLARAMKKYGRAMFRFSVLQNCATVHEAMSEERRLIALFSPKYNLSLGGDGGAGFVLTDKQRQQRSRHIKKHGAKVWAASAEAHRKPIICLKDGKVFSSGVDAADHYSIHRSTIAAHLSGNKALAGGLIFSAYTGTETALVCHGAMVEKIRDERRIRQFANRHRRGVICPNTGERYGSMREAAAKVGVPYGVLSRILRKKELKSWHGLKFEYAP